MRTLAIGFIGALTLAFAAPSWALGPTMNEPSLTVAGKDTCATRHRTYKTHRTHGGSGSSSDNSANMLNAQELSRLQGGAPAAPAPMPPGR
jgi:hypothetical protein